MSQPSRHQRQQHLQARKPVPGGQLAVCLSSQHSCSERSGALKERQRHLLAGKLQAHWMCIPTADQVAAGCARSSSVSGLSSTWDPALHLGSLVLCLSSCDPHQGASPRMRILFWCAA